MTRLLTSRRLSWAVPALVAAGVAAAAITTTNGAGASERPTLAPRTAAQLLASVEHARPANLSGTIVETANLGLPNLPTSDLGGGAGLSLQTLLTGSHTMRIWYAGPTQQRIAVLAPMSERDVIHDGTDVWTYTSTTNAVTHTTVPSPASTAGPEMSQTTPQRAAEQVLRAVDPSTRVTVDRTVRVAERPAYQLDLVPRDSRSLVGSVRIAVDAATSVPLRVQIFAKGAPSPAVQVEFTEVSFSAPDPAIFHFAPPADATVTQQQPGAGRAHLGAGSSHRPGGHHTGAPAAFRPTALSSGWTTVAKLPVGDSLSGSNAQLVNRLSTPVPAGRLITTSLVSVLITHEGDVFAGPVSGTAIQRVASTGHGL